MDISLPKPPTSNLYIYLAIFGLSIVIAGFVFKDHAESEARLKVIEFANYSSESIFEANNFAIGFENRSEAEKMKIRNKLELNRAKSETLAAEMMAYSRKFEEADNVKYFGIFIGGFISALGFLLWYRRTQRTKDKILENQAKPPQVKFKRPS
jgi:hypothetical protein